MNHARDRYRWFDSEREILLSAEMRSKIDDEKIYFSAFGSILLAIALGLSMAKAQYVP
jgi:hypothetical protein